MSAAPNFSEIEVDVYKKPGVDLDTVMSWCLWITFLLLIGYTLGKFHTAKALAELGIQRVLRPSHDAIWYPTEMGWSEKKEMTL